MNNHLHIIEQELLNCKYEYKYVAKQMDQDILEFLNIQGNEGWIYVEKVKDHPVYLFCKLIKTKSAVKYDA